MITAILVLSWLMATMVLWSITGRLLTAASDLAVIVGVLVFSLWGFVSYWVARRLAHSIRDILVDLRRPRIVKLLVIGLLLGAVGVGCTRVEPGYVGIRVNLYGSQRGVEDFPIVTGRVWYNPWSEDIYEFPTFLQNVVWDKAGSIDESITFNSIEGAIINADIALSYSFEGDKVPDLFVAFRKGPEEIRDIYMRSQVRDAFSRYAGEMKVVDVFGARKQVLLDRVKTNLEEELGPRGFKIDMVSFVGALRVDERVERSINAVIEATQRAIEAENKVRQSEAEAQQRIATAHGESESLKSIAAGQAEANRIVAQSLTPELVQWQAVQRWNGILPQVTSGGTPFIGVMPK